MRTWMMGSLEHLTNFNELIVSVRTVINMPELRGVSGRTIHTCRRGRTGRKRRK